MSFEKLGPLLGEARTSSVCMICNNFIYKRIYRDENSSGNQKVIFVCKNCLRNNKAKNSE
jgi:hypothetical protein